VTVYGLQNDETNFDSRRRLACMRASRETGRQRDNQVSRRFITGTLKFVHQLDIGVPHLCARTFDVNKEHTQAKQKLRQKYEQLLADH
jgi:hypothetical protein